MDQFGYRPPPSRLQRGRDDTGGLVDGPDLALLRSDRSAVHLYFASLADVSRRIGDDLPVDADPAGRDQPLRGAPRRDARVGEVLGEPHDPIEAEPAEGRLEG